MKRVVITGMGMVSAAGLGVEKNWEAIKHAQSFVKLIQDYDVSAYSTQFAARIENFQAEIHFERKQLKLLDPFVQYAMVASREAMAQAGLSPASIDGIGSERIGVAIGSGIGGLSGIQENAQNFHQKGPRRVSPFFIPTVIPNMAAGHVAMEHQLHGPNLCVATACTAGAHNLGMAMSAIQQGHADVMLAGGSEVCSSELGLAGFCSSRAMSRRNEDPEAASRPWDQERDGFVLADGAGILVLESLESAEKRGVQPLAELVSMGMSADAHHITAPPEDGRGALLAMRNALRQAKLDVNELSHINAHGTSTLAGDRAEANAIQALLKNEDAKVSVTSTKSMTGHALGAAGALEAVFCVKSLLGDFVPITKNLNKPDEGLELDFVMGEGRSQSQHYVMSNSFGFGGTNASLIFGKIR